MIFELDILDDEQLNHIKSKYHLLKYEDGRKSNDTSIKKNKTVYDGQVYNELVRYFYEILFKKVRVRYNIKKVSQGYFARYDEGDFYGWHYDTSPCAGIIHHYSMTVFLNDDYEGGELCLKLGDTVVEKKLKKGQALIYPSSLHHQVKPVLSGTRHVFLCWMQSMIQDQFIREVVQNIHDIDDLLVKDGSDFAHEVSCKLHGVYCKIINQYGSI